MRNIEKVIELFMEKFENNDFYGLDITIEYEGLEMLGVYESNELLGYIRAGVINFTWVFLTKNNDYIFEIEVKSLRDNVINYYLELFIRKCKLRKEIENCLGL